MTWQVGRREGTGGPRTPVAAANRNERLGDGRRKLQYGNQAALYPRHEEQCAYMAEREEELPCSATTVALCVEPRRAPPAHFFNHCCGRSHFTCFKMARSAQPKGKRKVEEEAAPPAEEQPQRQVKRRVAAAEREELHPVEHASHGKVGAGLGAQRD